MTTQLTITLSVETQSNGKAVCTIAAALEGLPPEIQEFQGQNQDHAIAIALENLATRYRKAAGEQQSRDWFAVERSSSGDPIEKRYHVILHYERIAEDESKFEARHNTIMGNTVVENAAIEVIEIDPDLPIESID
jgi:hypothetical protein